MKKNSRRDLFETTFANNFQPNWWEQLVMKLEVFRRDVIISLLPSSGDVLVDLACGDGDLLLANAQRYRSLIGFDIAKVRIDNAQRNLDQVKAKVQLQVADLDRGIPLPDNSADVVVCEAALNYFLRPDQTLEEIHRVLKKNGTFVVQVGNYAFLTRRLALLMGKMPKVSSFKGFGDGGMLHYFTYRTLRQLLEDKGFQITAQRNSGVAAQVRGIWPQLLASDIILAAKKK